MTESYLKGKDIKVHGDCLVNYMKFQIEIIVDGKKDTIKSGGYIAMPEEFDKW